LSVKSCYGNGESSDIAVRELCSSGKCPRAAGSSAAVTQPDASWLGTVLFPRISNVQECSPAFGGQGSFHNKTLAFR